MAMHLQILVPLRKDLVLALTIFLIPENLTLQHWLGNRFWQVPLEEAARRKSEPVHRCFWNCFNNIVWHNCPEHNELSCRNNNLLLRRCVDHWNRQPAGTVPAVTTIRGQIADPKGSQLAGGLVHGAATKSDLLMRRLTLIALRSITSL